MKWGFWGTRTAVLTATVAVLGAGAFAGIALASGGTQLATPQDTTSPVPEPPPTTTIAPTPDPAPQPAPAPKPAPTPRRAPTPTVVHYSPRPVVHTAPHVTPVLPAASRPTPRPRPQVVHPRRATVRKKHVRRTVHARRHVLAATATHVHVRIAQKLAEKPSRAASPVAVSPTTSGTRRRLVIIALLAIASLLFAVGAVPPHRLPRRVAWAIDERRIEILVASAGALAGAILTVLLTGGS